jgi:antibiotic biosynthesis monooxygenase (ABM) superfamily enzyme
MTTATKAIGPLAVLEAAFKIIPGKETAFLAYQASVVPLAAAQPGFRAGSAARFGTRPGYISERALTVRSK